MKVSRQSFIVSILFIIGSYILHFFSSINLFFRKKTSINFLRPPGTVDENTFLSLCIRCRACANVCEAGCIKFFSLLEGSNSAGTPYVNSRLRACNLCMNCTNVCPTSALKPIERELTAIKDNVDMGLAVVLESNCLSFNGRICGVCKDACPVEAIELFEKAKPLVKDDLCIGCGRCEERCPQTPTAIIVRREELLNYEILA